MRYERRFYLHVHDTLTNAELKGKHECFSIAATQEITVFKRFCFDFVSLIHFHCRSIFLYSYLRLPSPTKIVCSLLHCERQALWRNMGFVLAQQISRNFIQAIKASYVNLCLCN